MKNKTVTDNTLVLAIVLSMIVWGLGWPCNKVLTTYGSPINLIIYRYIIVLISLFPILLFYKTGLRINKQGIRAIIISGIVFAVYSYCFIRGLKHGLAGAGGVLVTTLNPIIAYTIGISLSRKKPSAREAIGILLGLIAGGILLKIWEHADAIFSSGNTYFVMAAFLWAVTSKYTSRSHLYGTSLGFSWWMYLVALACLLPLLDVQEFRSTMAVADLTFWFNMFFSSVMVTTLATTIYFYSTSKLGAEKASSFIFLVPLAAAVSSWLFLGEQILVHTMVGGAIGIAAVYIINRKPKT